jgi:hypothetical protein
MHIKRTLSIGRIDEKIKQSDHTKYLTVEERVSLLEELRYDLGKFLGYDYSRRLERSFSVVDNRCSTGDFI